MKKVCATGTVVKGIDISHWQRHVDWSALKADDIEFCFVKATEGTDYVDKMFLTHIANAQSHGMLVGAYHFFRPGADPVKQAEHFYKVSRALPSGHLPLVMDWETTDNMPSYKDSAAGLEFLTHLEKLSGHKPMIYTGPYFARSLGLDAQFARYPLWVAHYGTSCPLVPPPWNNWTFWQVSGKNIDHDQFQGTIDQLKRLTV